ncbi:WhiB family transcriptional regulator [Streptomyces roseifaciens]
MARPSRYAPDNLPRSPEWRDEAACSGVATAVFFPVTADGVPAAMEAAYAKAFCAVCPVVSACLEHALTQPENAGVWGGLDEGERAALLRAARRAAEEQRREERENDNATSAA